MPKKILLFAPCAFNLAETTRMLEIAKGVAHPPAAYSKVPFICNRNTKTSISVTIAFWEYCLQYIRADECISSDN